MMVSQIEIENLTLEELIELHKKIVRLIKEKNKMEILKEAVKFEIGDKVSFEHRGKTITGEVVKINQRSICIKSECDVCPGCGKPGYWNVDPRLVKKIFLQKENESVKI